MNIYALTKERLTEGWPMAWRLNFLFEDFTSVYFLPQVT